MNRDVELLKIQIVDDYFQTKISALYSYSLGAFVGILIFIGTLYYQGVFSVFSETNFNIWARIGNIIIFGVVVFIFYYYFRHKMSDSINNLNDKCLTYVGELLDKVERGEPLPPITELKELLKMK